MEPTDVTQGQAAGNAGWNSVLFLLCGISIDGDGDGIDIGEGKRPGTYPSFERQASPTPTSPEEKMMEIPRAASWPKRLQTFLL